MLRADPTGLLEAGAQCLAGTMQPDGQIVRCDAEICGHGGKRFALEVNPPEQIRISRTKRRQQPLQTRADGRSPFIQPRNLVITGADEFLQERFGLSVVGRMSAVIIDDRIAENAIKPCHALIRLFQTMHLLDGPEKALLKQILGRGLIRDPAEDKGAEI